MIRHIVFFSVRDPGDVPNVVSELNRLGEIAPVDHFEVARNEKCDLWHNEIDVVVYAEFADLDALSRYKADPIYEEVTARVRPKREMRVSADIAAARDR